MQHYNVLQITGLSVTIEWINIVSDACTESQNDVKRMIQETAGARS